MKQHQKPIGDSQVWLTPKWILDPLEEFDLDPCAAPSPRPWDTAASHIELPQDGLTANWNGRVWLNPPFHKYIRPLWMKKMAEHGNGIMLIPAATEVPSFKDHVWAVASSVLFLSRRPYFHRADGTRAASNSGCSICLVGYGDTNDLILKYCGLGQFIKLDEATR